MKHLTIFLVIFLSVLSVKAQSKKDAAQPLTIGEVRLMKSKVLGEERRLNVYLPEKFDKEKTYPVIYLLDGSMNEDFLHIAGLVQFYNLMFNMPDTIVVGIANVDRRRDFTFHTDLKDLREKYPTTGHSAKFIEFIETELQPYIQTVYKTNDTKYLIGQSLGGLLATEILLKKPHLFSHYLIVSPSLWWDNESLLGQAAALLEKQKNSKKHVFVAVGQEEDPIMVREAKEIAEILRSSNDKNLTLEYLPLPKENHATVLHQSINEALRKLFPYRE